MAQTNFADAYKTFGGASVDNVGPAPTLADLPKYPAADRIVREFDLRCQLPNGTDIPGMLSLTTYNTNYNVASRFEAKFALWKDNKFGPRFWKALQAQKNDQEPGVNYAMFTFSYGIMDSSNKMNWIPVMIAEADDLEVYWDTGTCIVKGADLTKRLTKIDTVKSYRNYTASQVIEEVAKQNGLATKDRFGNSTVDATTQLVGQFYDIEHVKANAEGELPHATKVWTLLQSLAQWSGKDLYIIGNVICFKNYLPDTADPYVVQVPEIYYKPDKTGGILGNSKVKMFANNFRFGRQMEVSRDFRVQVISYSKRTGRTLTGHWPLTQPHGVTANIQTYTWYETDHSTQGEVNARAATLAKGLLQNECRLTFSCAGELTLTPRTLIKLTGTNQGQPEPAPYTNMMGEKVIDTWDHIYHITEITRTLIFGQGFTEEIVCNNLSPQRTMKMFPE